MKTMCSALMYSTLYWNVFGYVSNTLYLRCIQHVSTTARIHVFGSCKYNASEYSGVACGKAPVVRGIEIQVKYSFREYMLNT